MADSPDYAAISPPSEKPPREYSYIERRAELYRLIEEAGHPHNLERSQAELGDRYGVSQKQISKDIERLREYEAEHNSKRTKSVTSWLAEKAVMSKVEAEEFDEALDIQMRYNNFLFDIGEMDKAASKVNIEGDASDAYMDMLRQAHEKAEDEES